MIGIPAAFASGRVLSSLLFSVSPRDLTAMSAAVTTLGVTAVIAAWIPARRAAAIDPIRALRQD
jgi:ABC-type antimicrobial peptide transport system permease subunit